jgi:hypothetical protein
MKKVRRSKKKGEKTVLTLSIFKLCFISIEHVTWNNREHNNK